MILFRHLESEFIQHALEDYPREACGLVVDGRYIRVPNISRDPVNQFILDPRVYGMYDGHIQAVFHSHPDGDECPTEADMRSQMTAGVPWIIAPTKGRNVGEIFEFGIRDPERSLIGRKFRHGVDDCYSLMRDGYKHYLNIDLAEFPRSWGWWRLKDYDMYSQNFASQGFRILEANESPQKYDALLVALGSAFHKANHAILYLGNGEGLHHPGSITKAYDPTRLSLVEGIARYVDSTTKVAWIRPELPA